MTTPTHLLYLNKLILPKPICLPFSASLLLSSFQMLSTKPAPITTDTECEVSRCLIKNYGNPRLTKEMAQCSPSMLFA